MSTDIAADKISRFSILKRVFSFARPYRKKFYWSVFLAVFLAVIAPVRPLLIQITINDGIKDGLGANQLAHFINGPGGFIIEITLLQILLLIIETGCRFIFTFSTASLGQSVVKDLRVSTFQKITSLNLSQFDKTPIGTLTTRTINDIESVNDIFSDGLIPIIADLLSIISVLTYMFWVDPLLTLVCMAPFPVMIIATYFFKEAVNKSFIRVRNAVAALNAFVQEHITGMGLVQAFAAEKREQKHFEDINTEHRNANVKAIFAYSVFFPIVELVSALSIGLLVWWAAKNSLQMEDAAAARAGSVITSFILCLNLLFRPLRVIADKFNVLQMGMIASERVFKVLDNPDVTGHTGSIGKDHSLRVNGSLSFDRVWFAYIGEQFVLKDVSFSIEPGQTLAIVGHTGSGKTSIISLINRLYKINKGQVLIDGKNIEEYNIDFLRSRIGVVLQDVFLFGGSILDNVTLRNPDISREQVEHAARLIGMDDFI
ncbi:MAG: ABC transporter ATP-binding protein, partial [Chitinophagaceae bacterium]